MDLPATQAIDDDEASQQVEEKKEELVGTLEIGNTSFPIVTGSSMIGRHPDCKIKLDHETLSKKHAEIEADTVEKPVFIKDLNSSNKTKINDTKLKPNLLYQIKDNDKLIFGKVTAIFKLQKVIEDSFIASTPQVRKIRPVIPGTPDSMNASASDSDVSAILGTQTDEANFRRPQVPARLSMTSNQGSPKLPAFCRDDLPSPVGKGKNNVEDIEDLETQKVPTSNDIDESIYSAPTQKVVSSNDAENIYEMETQRPNNHVEVEDDIQNLETQQCGSGKSDVEVPIDRAETPPKELLEDLETQQYDNRKSTLDSSNEDSIYNAPTQKRVSDGSQNDSIENLETQKLQSTSRESTNVSIYSAETQKRESLENAETQQFESSKRYSSNDVSIHSAPTQKRVSEVPNDDLIENLETQKFDDRKSLSDSRRSENQSIYTAETQVHPEVPDTELIENMETQKCQLEESEQFQTPTILKRRSTNKSLLNSVTKKVTFNETIEEAFEDVETQRFSEKIEAQSNVSSKSLNKSNLDQSLEDLETQKFSNKSSNDSQIKEFDKICEAVKEKMETQSKLGTPASAKRLSLRMSTPRVELQKRSNESVADMETQKFNAENSTCTKEIPTDEPLEDLETQEFPAEKNRSVLSKSNNPTPASTKRLSLRKSIQPNAPTRLSKALNESIDDVETQKFDSRNSSNVVEARKSMVDQSMDDIETQQFVSDKNQSVLNQSNSRTPASSKRLSLKKSFTRENQARLSNVLPDESIDDLETQQVEEKNVSKIIDESTEKIESQGLLNESSKMSSNLLATVEDMDTMPFIKEKLPLKDFVTHSDENLTDSEKEEPFKLERSKTRVSEVQSSSLQQNKSNSSVTKDDEDINEDDEDMFSQNLVEDCPFSYLTDENEADEADKSKISEIDEKQNNIDVSNMTANKSAHKNQANQSKVQENDSETDDEGLFSNDLSKRKSTNKSIRDQDKSESETDEEGVFSNSFTKDDSIKSNSENNKLESHKNTTLNNLQEKEKSVIKDHDKTNQSVSHIVSDSESDEDGFSADLQKNKSNVENNTRSNKRSSVVNQRISDVNDQNKLNKSGIKTDARKSKKLSLNNRSIVEANQDDEANESKTDLRKSKRFSLANQTISETEQQSELNQSSVNTDARKSKRFSSVNQSALETVEENEISVNKSVRQSRKLSLVKKDTPETKQDNEKSIQESNSETDDEINSPEADQEVDLNQSHEKVEARRSKKLSLANQSISESDQQDNADKSSANIGARKSKRFSTINQSALETVEENEICVNKSTRQSRKLSLVKKDTSETKQDHKKSILESDSETDDDDNFPELYQESDLNKTGTKVGSRKSLNLSLANQTLSKADKSSSNIDCRKSKRFSSVNKSTLESVEENEICVNKSTRQSRKLSLVKKDVSETKQDNDKSIQESDSETDDEDDIPEADQQSDLNKTGTKVESRRSINLSLANQSLSKADKSISNIDARKSKRFSSANKSTTETVKENEISVNKSTRQSRKLSLVNKDVSEIKQDNDKSIQESDSETDEDLFTGNEPKSCDKSLSKNLSGSPNVSKKRDQSILSKDNENDEPSNSADESDTVPVAETLAPTQVVVSDEEIEVTEDNDDAASVHQTEVIDEPRKSLNISKQMIEETNTSIKNQEREMKSPSPKVNLNSSCVEKNLSEMFQGATETPVKEDSTLLTQQLTNILESSQSEEFTKSDSNLSMTSPTLSSRRSNIKAKKRRSTLHKSTLNASSSREKSLVANLNDTIERNLNENFENNVNQEKIYDEQGPLMTQQLTSILSSQDDNQLENESSVPAKKLRLSKSLSLNTPMSKQQKEKNQSKLLEHTLEESKTKEVIQNAEEEEEDSENLEVNRKSSVPEDDAGQDSDKEIIYRRGTLGFTDDLMPISGDESSTATTKTTSRMSGLTIIRNKRSSSVKKEPSNQQPKRAKASDHLGLRKELSPIATPPTTVVVHRCALNVSRVQNDSPDAVDTSMVVKDKSIKLGSRNSNVDSTALNSANSSKENIVDDSDDLESQSTKTRGRRAVESKANAESVVSKDSEVTAVKSSRRNLKKNESAKADKKIIVDSDSDEKIDSVSNEKSETNVNIKSKKDEAVEPESQTKEDSTNSVRGRRGKKANTAVKEESQKLTKTDTTKNKKNKVISDSDKEESQEFQDDSSRSTRNRRAKVGKKSDKDEESQESQNDSNKSTRGRRNKAIESADVKESHEIKTVANRRKQGKVFHSTDKQSQDTEEVKDSNSKSTARSARTRTVSESSHESSVKVAAKGKSTTKQTKETDSDKTVESTTSKSTRTTRTRTISESSQESTVKVSGRVTKGRNNSKQSKKEDSEKPDDSVTLKPTRSARTRTASESSQESTVKATGRATKTKTAAKSGDNLLKVPRSTRTRTVSESSQESSVKAPSKATRGKNNSKQISEDDSEKPEKSDSTSKTTRGTRARTTSESSQESTAKVSVRGARNKQLKTVEESQKESVNAAFTKTKGKRVKSSNSESSQESADTAGKAPRSKRLKKSDQEQSQELEIKIHKIDVEQKLKSEELEISDAKVTRTKGRKVRDQSPDPVISVEEKKPTSSKTAKQTRKRGANSDLNKESLSEESQEEEKSTQSRSRRGRAATKKESSDSENTESKDDDTFEKPMSRAKRAKVDKTSKNKSTVQESRNDEDQVKEPVSQSLEASPRSSRRSCPSPGRGNYKVLFTGDKSENHRKIVKKLGGTEVDDLSKCTILITDKIVRTFKFLCALSKGIPIVSASWLEKSSKANRFLNWEDYLLKDPSSESKYQCNLQESLGKARKHKFLEGFTILLAPHTTPPTSELKEMVISSGGKPILRAPAKWPSNTIVITKEDNLESAKKLVAKAPKSITIHSTEFILTGILRQEVNLEEFKLS